VIRVDSASLRPSAISAAKQRSPALLPERRSRFAIEAQRSAATAAQSVSTGIHLTRITAQLSLMVWFSSRTSPPGVAQGCILRYGWKGFSGGQIMGNHPCAATSNHDSGFAFVRGLIVALPFSVALWTGIVAACLQWLYR
jgi:hypothetical protein